MFLNTPTCKKLIAISIIALAAFLAPSSQMHGKSKGSFQATEKKRKGKPKENEKKETLRLLLVNARKGAGLCCLAYGLYRLIHQLHQLHQPHQPHHASGSWNGFEFGFEEYSWFNNLPDIEPIAPSDCLVNKSFIRTNFFPATSQANFIKNEHKWESKITNECINMLTEDIFPKIDYAKGEKIGGFAQSEVARELVRRCLDLNEKTRSNFYDNQGVKENIPKFNACIAHVQQLITLENNEKHQAIADNLVKQLLETEGECYGAIQSLCISISSMLGLQIYKPQTLQGKLVYQLARDKAMYLDRAISKYIYDTTVYDPLARDRALKVTGTHVNVALKCVATDFIGLQGEENLTRKMYDKEAHFIPGYYLDEERIKPRLQKIFEEVFSPEQIVDDILNSWRGKRTKEQQATELGMNGCQDLCVEKGCKAEEIYTDDYTTIKKTYLAGLLVSMGIFEES